jgi:tetratricopeptide (TPR) repeat protein
MRSQTLSAMLQPLKPFVFLAVFAAALASGAQTEKSDRFDALLVHAQSAQATGNFSSAASDYLEAVKLREDIPELWANLGFMESQLNQYEKAIDAFKEALRLKPTLFAPYLFIGLDYMQLKQLDRAIPFLHKAQLLNPSDIQAALALGRAYYASKDYPSAVEAFERAILSDRTNQRAWLGVGMSQLEEVEVITRDILSGDRNTFYVQALFAEALTEQGKYAQAAEVYRKIQKVSDPYLCSRSALGFILFRQNDGPGADALFQEEAIAYPGCGEARLGLVLIAITRASYSDALGQLQRLWSNDPAFVREHLAILANNVTTEQATALKESARSQAAAKVIDPALADLLNENAGTEQQSEPPIPQAVGSSPSPSGRGRHLSTLLYDQGKYSECSRRLLQDFPTLTAQQLQLLAACSSEAGDFQTVIRASIRLAVLQPGSIVARYWHIKSSQRLSAYALAEAEKVNPNSPTVHLLLGDMYRQRQRFDDAIAEYEKAIALSPGSTSASFGLAVSYFMEAKLDEAMVNAQVVLDHKPDDPDINLLIAEICVAQSDYPSAEPFLVRSQNVVPELRSHVHALLGEVYAASDRIPEAIEEMRQGLSSDRDGSIHYQLARLYKKTGQTTLSAQAMQEAKELKASRIEDATMDLKNAASEWKVQDELP